jgi:hypothetical protein
MGGVRRAWVPVRRLGVLAVTGAMTLLAMAAIGSTAKSDSITYSNIPLFTKTQPGYVPEFDPSLGVLTEVIYHVVGGFGKEFEVNPFPAPPLLDYTDVISLILFRYDGDGGDAFSVSRRGTVQDIGPLDPYINISDQFDFTGTQTDAFSLSRLYGTSFLSVQLVVMISENAPNVFPINIIPGLELASGTASVTYVYTAAVPEPSGVILGSLSLALLGGLAVVRRRLHRRTD